jgi:hypothetical protein
MNGGRWGCACQLPSIHRRDRIGSVWICDHGHVFVVRWTKRVNHRGRCHKTWAQATLTAEVRWSR